MDCFVFICQLALLFTFLNISECRRDRESLDSAFLKRSGLVHRSSAAASRSNNQRATQIEPVNYLDDDEEQGNSPRYGFSRSPIRQRIQERDPYFDPNADRSYQFQFDTSTYDRQEVSDSQGNVRGRYSYVDADGVTRQIVYRAGPGIGFVIESMNPPASSFADPGPRSPPRNSFSHPKRNHLGNKPKPRRQQLFQYTAADDSNDIYDGTTSYQEQPVETLLNQIVPNAIGTPDTMSSYFSSPSASYTIYSTPTGGQVKVSTSNTNSPYNYSYETDVGTPLAILTSRLASQVPRRAAFASSTRIRKSNLRPSRVDRGASTSHQQQPDEPTVLSSTPIRVIATNPDVITAGVPADVRVGTAGTLSDGTSSVSTARSSDGIAIAPSDTYPALSRSRSFRKSSREHQTRSTADATVNPN